MPEASAILCTQGTSPLLPHAVAALREQTGVDLELVIVVDGDAPALAERLDVAGDAAVTVVSEPARSLNRKRNRGVAVAAADKLLFTDDDCVAAPSWAAACVAALGSHPVVTGRVEPLNRGYRVSTRVGREPRVFRGRWHELLTPWRPGCGNNLALRRATLAQVGGFVEWLGVGTWSGAACDTELLYRLLRAGIAIAYEPEAVIYHAQPIDRADYLHKRRLYYRGFSYLARHVHRGDPMATAAALLRMAVSAGGYTIGALTLQRSARMRTAAELRGALEGWTAGAE